MPAEVRQHDDDRAAIAAAVADFPMEPLEIWQGARLVRVLERDHADGAIQPARPAL